MPFGDRTGPAGFGPKTGRGAGYCSGAGVPGSMNPAGGGAGWGGRGGGMGRGGGGMGRGGGGRGWRNWFYATGLTGWQRAAAAPPTGFEPPAPAATAGGDPILEALKAHASSFENALEGIRKRIDDLEAKSKPE